MPSYTYKIGRKAVSGSGLAVVAHSRVLVVATLGDALEKARGMAAQPGWEEADRAILVDDTGIVYPVWDRPDGTPQR